LIAFQGSGKTLAYGLPILTKLLEENQNRPLRKKRRVSALILTPTRELALQVSSHLNACLSPSSEPGMDDDKKPKSTKSKTSEPTKPPAVSIAAIVGGMSAQKQRRVLNRGADILVATPGRFWDLLQEVCEPSVVASLSLTGKYRTKTWHNRSKT
jgi:ATP-dependent RNA helicase DDX24/MAK5